MVHRAPVIPAILEHSAFSVTSISLRIRGERLAYTGQISGQRIQSALAFAFSDPCEASAEATCALPAPPSEDSLLWQTVPAELEGKPLKITFAHGRYASYFKCSAAEFWIDASGNSAELTRFAGDPSVWLFGPMLILALARRHVFCLHGSAVLAPFGALVIVGASGAGKSTLASAARPNRLCDDISPLSWRDGALTLLPQFPQLKLAGPDVVPEAVPLRGILHLHAAVEAQGQSIRALTGHELHRQLLAHTVASRLFTSQDCQHWWEALSQWCKSLEACAFALRPAHDAQAPDRAMIEALNAVATLIR